MTYQTILTTHMKVTTAPALVGQKNDSQGHTAGINPHGQNLSVTVMTTVTTLMKTMTVADPLNKARSVIVMIIVTTRTIRTGIGGIVIDLPLGNPEGTMTTTVTVPIMTITRGRALGINQGGHEDTARRIGEAENIDPGHVQRTLTIRARRRRENIRTRGRSAITRVTVQGTKVSLQALADHHLMYLLVR